METSPEQDPPRRGGFTHSVYSDPVTIGISIENMVHRSHFEVNSAVIVSRRRIECPSWDPRLPEIVVASSRSSSNLSLGD